MKSKGTKSIFKNILMYLTLTTSISILLVSFGLYKNFERINLTQIYNSSLNNLEQISISVETMTLYATSVSTQLFLMRTIIF